MKIVSLLLSIIAVILFTHCATYKTQYKSELDSSDSLSNSNLEEIDHSFYLIGDAGNANLDSVPPALNMLENELKNASKNSTLLFLGDNVYPKGMPNKESELRVLAEYRLKVQTKLGKTFLGETIFTPGNHDWYNGLKGLKRQEKFVEKELGKDSFLPENGCPLEKVKISEQIDLIIADTQWYLTDWNKHPTVNDQCEIKTRESFLSELEGMVKKARGKTTILMFHHPLLTNGTHGGNYDFKSHLKPLPVLGSLKNLIRKTGGVSPQDNQNKQYNYLVDRLLTIASKNEKVIVVSGHDHNLQLFEKNNLFQIISGSGSKSNPTKLQDANFVSSDNGFARLDIYKNGASKIHFFSANQQKEIYNQILFKSIDNKQKLNYSETFPKEVTANIYEEKLLDKSSFDQWAFGNRYRDLYGVPVKVPTVKLDTLYGGLVPVRKGGGNQSKSLRLKNTNGKEYVMRALKKEAVQYLQSFAFKTKNIKDEFNNTSTENLVLDIFAGSHPYAPFIVGDLADAIKVYHANPILFYVPKQNALKGFNTEFGDELYMIEERAADGHGDLKSFGYSNELISTDDLLKNLRKSSKYYVDQSSYVRARLFDMILGDWDRHYDQWRWATFKDKEDKTFYRPVPRDRDQAFSRISDGWIMNMVTLLITESRLLQNYEKDLKDVKWFNLEPYPLDVALLSESNKELWNKEVNFIKANLTDQVIQKAFSKLPQEVQDESKNQIIEQFKKRRDNLQEISDHYFWHLNQLAVVKGTDKKDWIEIVRLNNGKTNIKIFTSKNNQKNQLYFERTFKKEQTREIWVYALDEDDKITVKGDGENLIKLIIVGGQNNDIYNIENKKKVTVYDFKSKKNTFLTNVKKHLSDDYKLNTYDYKKPKYNKNQFFPIIGSNPDDGLKIGFSDTYYINRFKRNPFTSRYQLTAEYFFATSGLLLNFQSEFALVFGDFNLLLDATYTTPSFAQNFFGFGNETENLEPDSDNFDLDYNRVRTRVLRFAPSINRQGVHGSNLKIGVIAEDVAIEKTNGRFINTFLETSGEPDTNQLVGITSEYSFVNKNDFLFPTLGMDFNIDAGAKYNFETEEPFGFIGSHVRFDHRITPSGKIVLSTEFGGKILIGDEYPFYEAATIGASNGLRGFRRQRFSGKQSYYQTTDLRYQFKGSKTKLFPVRLGLYAGFDYGRVWQPNEDSKQWHNSYGGGAFMNIAEIATLNLGLFTSSEDTLIAFKFGMGF